MPVLDFDQLPEGPFVRLRALLAGVEPGMAPIDLGIGEPRHAVPRFVTDLLAQQPELYGRYPPTDGTPGLRAAAASWLARRFDLPAGFVEPDLHVVPVNGTREALFLAAFLARPKPPGVKAAVLIPNPFYQAYAGAALAIGAEPVYLPATAETNFFPDLGALDEALLARTAIVYLCSPANPQGTVAGPAYWRQLLSLARTHGFFVYADECYSEIYDREAPHGALEAAAATGALDGLLTFNSLSKRSSLPGLRSGFVAGDADLIARFKKLRLYGGAPSPIPVQNAAEAAWKDDSHVAANRAAYRAKLDGAERVFGNRLGFYRPPGGFFLWLDMSEIGLTGEEAALRLWKKGGVRVLPGSYLARAVRGSSGALSDPGERYIRLALVHDGATTLEALRRVNQFL